MAELDLTAIASNSIATPASGVIALFGHSVSKQILTKRDDGVIDGILSNQSVSTPGAGLNPRKAFSGRIVRPSTIR